MFGKKKVNGKVIGATLVEGLPISEGSDLVVKLTDEGLTLIVASTKQEFEIDISKLTLIDNKNEVEMQHIVKQSAPGMIIGAATFGLLGAMVGGRVKTEEKKIVTHFVIINYHSDEDKTIVLKTNDGIGAGQIADLFRKFKPQSTPLKVVL
jgi:outer membrane lipoprotein SlyB